jgi:tRNA dimethylallyltransferase
MRRPIPVIIGPTAVGKTELALTLARDCNAEIIGGDSRQIYRHLDIGTAKPSPAQRQAVPHHLIDVIDPGTTLNAARYARLAWGCIRSIEAGGKRPLVVGGSGLYVRALTDGLFAGPGANPPMREGLEAAAQAVGWQALHERLAAVDPAAARRIHPHDRVRIIRALEIYTLTGQPISQWQCQWQNPPSRRRFLLIGLSREREDLRQRITARTGEMLRLGLEDEVRTLLAMGYSPSLSTLQSVGYGEIIAYLEGKWDLTAAKTLIERHTWRLAKRQMTWFRRMASVHWISLTDTPESAALQHIRDLVSSARDASVEMAPCDQQNDREEPCTCPVWR